MKKWLLLLTLVQFVGAKEAQENVALDKAVKKSVKKTKSVSVQEKKIMGPAESKASSKPSTENNQEQQPTVVDKPVAEDLPKAETVNKIAVIIYVTAPSQPGSDKELEKVSDIVITLLDIERPSIDGRMRSLDELIIDKLMAFEAIHFYRMSVSDDAIDKYINSIKEHYSISDQQLRDMFKQAGYTYEEGREQLGAAQAVDSLIHFKIRSRLVVPEKDVRAYYNEHPVYEEASYKIKKAFIPDGTFTEDELEHLSDKMMKKASIEWSSPYLLLHDEMIDERREMLEGMKVDEYSKPEQVTGGYEVIKLLTAKPRTLKSFEDSYREITAKLQEPHYYKMLEDLKKELFAKYKVEYL